MQHASPTTAQRAWAAAALVLSLGAAAAAVVAIVRRFPLSLAALACVALAVPVAWIALSRGRTLRLAGLALAAALIAGSVVLALVEGVLIENLVILAALAGAGGAARQAFRVHVALPPASRPERAVLFYNPKSGGGKAERFHLPDEARRRGIEPVQLHRGDDLETLVRDAVAGGADALAMAGGDGSQAIVAMVAAELELPYACIPAGTRNHFALDLGVDRDDVVGALDAFVDGGERVVDLAEVNGRVFVNNVSLGLYAEAVARPGYREAKLHTLLETVPSVLGPDADPPSLVWDGPRGPESAVAILVSNSPYRLGRPIGSGTRPRLDTGALGITVLAPNDASAGGSGQSRLQMQQWTQEEFEISSTGSVPAGVDGESLRFDPPLRFTVRPQALHVRIAPQHPGASPSAAMPDRPGQMIRELGALALRGESAGRLSLPRGRSAVH
ncbi:MAG TPA: diacylglycerol kinase family protein [Solirubrobacteraceae bacterium]|nr:diacylglycerol kinase family protein [Solirubrobacteraceae bacterium]